MFVKNLEIRDRGTTITAIAIKTKPENINEALHFKRGGWGENNIILIKTNGQSFCTHDPFHWKNEGNRTMFEAHHWLEDNFDEIDNFGVLDIEYIKGETDKKKNSEIL